MSEGFPLNRKETFSASMIIFIGFFYILSLVSAFFQTKSLPANRIFGLAEFKFLFLGLFYLGGAISFFRLKNIGWVICTATLLNISLVVFRLVITISQNGAFNAIAVILISCFILALMAFIFLFGKQTRAKFLVNNKSYLLTIGAYCLLLAMTFLL